MSKVIYTLQQGEIILGVYSNIKAAHEHLSCLVMRKEASNMVSYEQYTRRFEKSSEELIYSGISAPILWRKMKLKSKFQGIHSNVNGSAGVQP